MRASIKHKTILYLQVLIQAKSFTDATNYTREYRS